MNEQIKIKDNTLTINSVKIKFDYNIREAKICGDLIIVLLAIPFSETELDNLYAVSKQGKMVWRVQELNKAFPNPNNLPYEQMNIKGNEITVTDFYARRYFINPLNGNIEKKDMVK